MTPALLDVRLDDLIFGLVAALGWPLPQVREVLLVDALQIERGVRQHAARHALAVASAVAGTMGGSRESLGPVIADASWFVSGLTPAEKLGDDLAGELEAAKARMTAEAAAFVANKKGIVP